MPFGGNAGSEEPKSGGILILTVDAGPNQSAGWRGASGSGVFIHDGLCAVVIEAYQGHTGKLRSQLLAPLLADPDFASAVAWSPDRDRRTSHTQKTIEDLSSKENAGLVGLLAKKLGLTILAARTVAEAIAHLSDRDFVDLGTAVGDDLIGDGIENRYPDGKKLAPVMEKIVETGLAARLGSMILGRLILRSDGHAAGGLVRLPCMYPMLAEHFSAGIDNRSPKLISIPPAEKEGADDPWKDLRQHGHEHWPTLCIPFEPPVGFGDDAMDRAVAILNHLLVAFNIDSLVKSHFPDFRPNDSAHLESRFWPIWGFLRESQHSRPREEERISGESFQASEPALESQGHLSVRQ
jgi:hypothetical protein